MKNINKIWIILITLTITISCILVMPKTVDAQIARNYKVISLRAGGGTSSSGGSSGTSSNRTTTSNGSGTTSNPFSRIIDIIIFITIASIGSIVLYVKVLKSSFKSKKYMKLLDDKDIAWKYKDIERQVINAYYIIQQAWADGNMSPAKDYMTSNLLENFQTKLNWMEVKHQKNVLKNIKLVNVKPISVHDNKDNEKDTIWFYIKGRMVDFIIDTTTEEIISGENKSTSFVEFWKFKRQNNTWVLAKILQKEEENKIVFEGEK